MKILDFEATEKAARKMTAAALVWSRKDALEAAECAEQMEAAGCQVDKTGGYYRDEAGIYASELARRQASK